jgi:hypothetical protein
VPAVDAASVDKLIADLDTGKFPQRQAAYKELELLGDRASGLLRLVLEKQPSLETRRRLESLLSTLRDLRPGEDLRRRRAIHTLEDIGSPAAWEILEGLGKVSPDTGESLDAKASLERINARVSKAP